MAETPSYGTARIVNQNELELERYVDSDVILPFYRIPLTGEHLASWVVGELLQQGCRCKRLVNSSSAGVRRATRKDSGLVYYSVGDASVTVIRNGNERVMAFSSLKDRDMEDFTRYVADLLCDDPPKAGPV